MDRYGQVAYNMNNVDSDALKITQDVALDIAGDIVLKNIMFSLVARQRLLHQCQ